MFPFEQSQPPPLVSPLYGLPREASRHPPRLLFGLNLGQENRHFLAFGHLSPPNPFHRFLAELRLRDSGGETSDTLPAPPLSLHLSPTDCHLLSVKVSELYSLVGTSFPAVYQGESLSLRIPPGILVSNWSISMDFVLFSPPSLHSTDSQVPV